LPARIGFRRHRLEARRPPPASAQGVQQGRGTKSFACTGVGAGNKINSAHDSDGLIKKQRSF